MRWRLLLILSTTALLCMLMQQPSNVHAQGTILWSANHELASEAEWYSPGGAGHGGGEYDSGCAGTAPLDGFGRNPSGTNPYPFSLVLTMRSCPRNWSPAMSARKCCPPTDST